MSKGFIYILGNNSMPGLLKIGYSTKVPTERKDELFTTGVPEPFQLYYYCLVESAQKHENEVHKKLSNYRNVKSREFFAIDVSTAIETIRKLCSIEHEWLDSELREKPNDSINKSNLDNSNNDNNSIKKKYQNSSHGIEICSRYENKREITEMINFCNLADESSLSKYVKSLFYDSKSCCCSIKFLEKTDASSDLSNAVLEIARKTIVQFDWFGYVEHGAINKSSNN